MRPIDRDLIRGGHYGQRPRVPHFKGRTHGCTDQGCKREESSCQLGAVHTWHIASFAALQHFGSYWGKSGHGRASRLARLCVHGPLVKATNGAVADIVGAGNISEHLTGLTTSDGFLALMSREFGLTS